MTQRNQPHQFMDHWIARYIRYLFHWPPERYTDDWITEVIDDNFKDPVPDTKPYYYFEKAVLGLKAPDTSAESEERKFLNSCRVNGKFDKSFILPNSVKSRFIQLFPDHRNEAFFNIKTLAYYLVNDQEVIPMANYTGSFESMVAVSQLLPPSDLHVWKEKNVTMDVDQELFDVINSFKSTNIKFRRVRFGIITNEKNLDFSTNMYIECEYPNNEVFLTLNPQYKDKRSNPFLEKWTVKLDCPDDDAQSVESLTKAMSSLKVTNKKKNKNKKKK